jgi:hypothetical protein
VGPGVGVNVGVGVGVGVEVAVGVGVGVGGCSRTINGRKIPPSWVASGIRSRSIGYRLAKSLSVRNKVLPRINTNSGMKERRGIIASSFATDPYRAA